MCWCTPNIRTPNCGKIGCYPPNTMNFKFGIDDKVKLITHDLNGVIMRLCKEKECYVYDVEYINNNGKIEEIRCFESDLELLKVGVNG